jgi:hypothetical protein
MVDLMPLLTSGTSLFGLVLSALATVGFRYVSAWLKAKTTLYTTEAETQMSNAISSVVHRGIDYATQRMNEAIADPKSGVTTFKIDNIFYQWAINYVIESVPGYLKQLGLDPANQLTHKRIEDMITARLPFTTAVSTSPMALPVVTAQS